MNSLGGVRTLDRTHLERVFEYSLLAMLASAYFAVLGSRALDPVSAIGAGSALAARFLHLLGWMPLNVPPRWVTAATLVYFAFYPVDYLYITREFVTATVHLVLFVAVAKLLSARTPRDYLFLKIIAFLELLAAALLSDNLSFFVFLSVFLFATVATFASSEMLRSWQNRQVVSRGVSSFPKRFAWLTLLTSTGIVLITGTLFFVLPRTARAALERLIPANQRIGGLASEVTLGQVGELRRQSTALLHVRFEGPPPPPGHRYRGAALAEFNGWKWYNTPQIDRQPRTIRASEGFFKLASDTQLRRPGRRYRYQVVMRGMPGEQIFFLGTPEYLRLARPMIWEMPAGGYRLPWVESEGLRYVADTFLPDAKSPPPPPARMTEAERNFQLRLPPVDPGVIRLAQQITAGLKTDRDRSLAIERWLREKFTYSLEPLDHQVDDPLAYFLLQRKKGHCEYFASSMAVMLRLLWIPARVVTGFQSGVENPMSGWHIVRASDAHSWVEAWLPEEGWVEFDPTPSDPSSLHVGMWSRLALALDAADTFWQDWVVGYDLDRQITLALEVERTSRQFRWAWIDDLRNAIAKGSSATSQWNLTWVMWVAGAAALAALLYVFGPAVLARLRRLIRLRRVTLGRGEVSDCALLYESMLELLHKRGIQKPAWLTPREFCETLPPSPASEAVREFTLRYYEVRFGGSASGVPELALLLNRIRQLP